MKLIFIKGNQEVQQFIPLMSYAIRHTLEEKIMVRIFYKVL
jgi:hypothetical protein